MAESKGKIGSLFYGMSLDTKEFRKKLKDVRKKLAAQGKAMREDFKKIAKGFAIVGGAGIAAGAGMLLFAKNTLAATNAQLLLADSIGATQAEIAGLDLMAEKFGVSQDMLVDKMREFGGLDEFKKIADQVQGAGDEMAQLAKAQELLGNEGLKLLPILQQGASGFAAMEKEAVALGLALSPGQVAESRVAWEELESTIFAVKGLGKQIGTAFAGPLGTMASGVKAFITTFKDDILAGVKLAADLLTKMIKGTFDLFIRFGIPFINGFISGANQIGEAFETLFSFLAPATDGALGGFKDFFNGLIAFISTFRQAMIIGITKPIQFILEGAFKMLGFFTKQLGLLIGGLAQRMAMFKVISQETADSIGGFFNFVGQTLDKAGKQLAKPLIQAQKNAADEMEDILIKQAVKNKSQQLQFKGILDSFSIKFGEALENAGKIAEKVVSDISGTSISDQFSGLALAGSQEAQSLINRRSAERIQQDQLREQKKTNKLLKNLESF